MVKKESIYKRVVNWCKNRYALETDLDVWLVFVLFAVTGSSAVRFGDPLLAYFGFETGSDVFSAGWFKFWAIRLPVIFIFYQLLFVSYGFFIGFFRKPVWNFAWSFEKKMLSRFGIKFKS